MSQLIDGIKLYQDEEYNSMLAEFERVERLLALDAKGNIQDVPEKVVPPESERLQLQEPIATHTLQNYRYAKWTLLFLVILFFTVMMKIYLRRFADFFWPFDDRKQKIEISNKILYSVKRLFVHSIRKLVITCKSLNTEYLHFSLLGRIFMISGSFVTQFMNDPIKYVQFYDR